MLAVAPVREVQAVWAVLAVLVVLVVLAARAVMPTRPAWLAKMVVWDWAVRQVLPVNRVRKVHQHRVPGNVVAQDMVIPLNLAVKADQAAQQVVQPVLARP